MNTPVLDIVAVPTTPHEALELAYNRSVRWLRATGQDRTLDVRAEALNAELAKLGWDWNSLGVVAPVSAPARCSADAHAGLAYLREWEGFYPEGSETL